MTLDRARLRAAATAFNQGPHRERLWADVLSTEDQIGASLTIYRRLGGNETLQYEPLARYTIASDEAVALHPVEGYGPTPRPDEQAALDGLVASVTGT